MNSLIHTIDDLQRRGIAVRSLREGVHYSTPRATIYHLVGSAMSNVKVSTAAGSGT